MGDRVKSLKKLTLDSLNNSIPRDIILYNEFYLKIESIDNIYDLFTVIKYTKKILNDSDFYHYELLYDKYCDLIKNELGFKAKVFYETIIKYAIKNNNYKIIDIMVPDRYNKTKYEDIIMFCTVYNPNKFLISYIKEKY